MPLLEIKPTKKINVLCSLEESTALMVNQYAAFAKAPGDDVVNKALRIRLQQGCRVPEISHFESISARRTARKEVCVSASATRRGPKSTAVAAD
jgi:hypothetical protein